MSKTHDHPDYSEFLPRLNRARGQLDGIERMISQRRYCMDILTQLRAATSALRGLEAVILESHLHECVSTALRSRDRRQIDAKISELTELLSRSAP
jgi:DNA-binding FrmR family transcriptional regulator